MARRYWQTADVAARVDRLLKRASVLTRREKCTTAGAKQRAVVPVILSVILVVLTLAVSAPPAWAQTCDATRGVRLWADVSGSLDLVEASRVWRLVGLAVAELECLDWVAVHEFAVIGDILGAAKFFGRNVLPPRFICAADPPRDYARFLRREVEKYEQRCTSERQALEEPYLNARAEYRSALLASVSSVDFAPADDPPSTCLKQALARGAADGPDVVNVFVTDGAHHKCDVDPSGLLRLAPNGTARILVVLVPSASNPGRFVEGIAELLTAIESSFPEAELVASFIVQDRLDFQRILLPLH